MVAKTNKTNGSWCCSRHAFAYPTQRLHGEPPADPSWGILCAGPCTSGVDLLLWIHSDKPILEKDRKPYQLINVSTFSADWFTCDVSASCE